MTTSTALTSELEAINTLLGSIGESKINTLLVTGMADVAAAKDTLLEVSRAAQTVGYHFNTESAFPLPRGSDNTITLPPNVLKVSIPDNSNIVQRGSKLYDKEKHTDVFEKTQEGTLVFFLEWDDLPQAARHYIMIAASRVFQARTLGSDTQYRFSEADEAKALKALNEAEGETGSYNMFRDSSSVSGIVSR